jgi:hypothetical protein
MLYRFFVVVGIVILLSCRAWRLGQKREVCIYRLITRCVLRATAVAKGGGCTIFGYYDNSVRGKDWRCRKRVTQAT